MKPDVTSRECRFRAVSLYLGQCFRTLRCQARVTQGFVADKSRLSRCTVSDFENGKRPTIGIHYVESMTHAVGATLMILVSMADKASQEDPERLK
jgi:transcriptional regulator with XRE-family HTH domain